MKALVTQVGTFHTPDDVAEAVLEYWLALTEERRADVVRIPIVTPEGEEAHVRLTLVGTAPLAVVDAKYVPDLVDGDAAAAIFARARALSSPGIPLTPEDFHDESFGDDWSRDRS